MNNFLLKIYERLQELSIREEGQDMVEYALVVALMGFGVAAGIQSVAAGISGEFTRVSATLVSYIS